MEMSSSPPLMIPSASLRFEAGRTASGLASYHSSNRSSKALSLKK